MGGKRSPARALTAVCFEVSVHSGVLSPDAESGSAWLPGPFPWLMPDGRPADADARGTYFQSRAAEALYGRAGTRWHRATPGHYGMLGAELLLMPSYGESRPGRRFLAVIHLDIPEADVVRGLAAAVSLDAGKPTGRTARETYTAALGPGITIPGSVRRAFAVTLLTFSAKNPLAPAGTPLAWDPVTGWLWALAAATPFADFCPDTGDPRLLAGTIYLSATWRGLVLRDGVAFVGLTADPGAGAGSFFDWGEVYVRSLYCDVGLLAALQRDALNDFADRLAAIGNRFDSSADLKALVNEVTEFRNLLWWEDVGRHSIGNELLRRLQEAHGTPELFARVVADLEAFRDQVDSRAIEATAADRRSEELRTQRFERVASIAATAFALPALVFTALALPISGLTTIPAGAVIVIGVGTAITGAIIGAFGSGRIRGFKRTK